MGPTIARQARAVLPGRETECARLDQLLAEAHEGQSAVLVLRGEPGIGKSALLKYPAERADGCRVLRAVGVECELELPFAQPDRFLIGLAVLSLLSDAAEEHPLMCLADDVQWLDRSSAQVLGFVARRLAVESVVLLFAEREPSRLEELAGLPELSVGGLAEPSAREDRPASARASVGRRCASDLSASARRPRRRSACWTRRETPIDATAH